MRHVRRLTDTDVERFAELRREALNGSGLSFAASPATDVASIHPATVVFGAFEDDRLIGMAGLLRGRHEKSLHQVHLWGMYVTPAFRRHGIGAELLEAAIAHARSMSGVSWIQLGVSGAAPAARRLYERFGFEAWGTEPDALRDGNESAAQIHMALRL